MPDSMQVHYLDYNLNSLDNYGSLYLFIQYYEEPETI